jgi:hypothetical protein
LNPIDSVSLFSDFIISLYPNRGLCGVELTNMISAIATHVCFKVINYEDVNFTQRYGHTKERYR